MGAWGTALFSNDIAPEAKETYIECLKLGKSDEEAYEYTLNECADFLSDEEDQVDFGLALLRYCLTTGGWMTRQKKTHWHLLDVKRICPGGRNLI